MSPDEKMQLLVRFGPAVREVDRMNFALGREG